MALCRLCHWGFDEGMLGVSDNYTIITARSIGINPNFPGLLTSLSGRGIIPPTDRDKYPAREYLAEHRPNGDVRSLQFPGAPAPFPV